MAEYKQVRPTPKQADLDELNAVREQIQQHGVTDHEAALRAVLEAFCTQLHLPSEATASDLALASRIALEIARLQDAAGEVIRP